MKKLDGNLKHNIAVLISGRGSNLKSIIKQSLKKKTSYKVKVIISNNQKAKGLLILADTTTGYSTFAWPHPLRIQGYHLL